MRTNPTRWCVVILLVLGCCWGQWCAAVALRECPNCMRAAISNEWIYCPWCGYRLPPPGEEQTSLSSLSTPYQILGNIYYNRKYGFSIERPSANWTFVYAESELADLNPDACVALRTDDEILSFVIIETLPHVTFKDYVENVAPALDDVTLISDNGAMINGLPARKRVWQGQSGELLFRFLYTFIQMGDHRVQIVTLCPADRLNPPFRDEIDMMHVSFRPLTGDSDTALQTETQAAQELEPEPTPTQKPILIFGTY